MAKRLRKKKSQTTLPREKNPLEPRPNEQELRNLIAEKAYQLYEKRGHISGHDLEDWLEAERLVLAKLNPPS